MIVPPLGDKSAKIMIIGEAPGRQEERRLEPFVGSSGQLLKQVLFRVPILWNDCYITNVIKERPPKNNLSKFISFTKKGAVHKEGYDKYEQILKEEVEEVQPNVVIALGNAALYALCRLTGITNWRGSILESTLVPGVKVIPSIHPSAALREYMYQYYMYYDFVRAKRESAFPHIDREQFDYITNPTLEDSLSYLDSCTRSDLVAFDIEVGGYKHGLSEVSCISFSYKPDQAISIALTRGGQARFSPENELLLWDKINGILGNPNLRKVAQNAFFDTQFLFRRYGIITKNCEDTMIAQAILRPDFPKGLDFITSIYTDIGYYKVDGKEFFGGRGNEESFWVYNAKDSIVLSIAFPKMEMELKSRDLWDTYISQNSLVEPLVFMSEYGIKIDTEGLAKKAEETGVRLEELERDFKRLSKKDINLRSHKQLKDYFYGPKSLGGLGLKPYLKKGKPTTDERALTRMSRPITGRPAVKEATILLEHRNLSKMKGTYYEMSVDPDGRMRSSLNPVGTRYGRLSSSENIFGTGTNIQNQPYAMKEFFLVDEKYIAYEIDLAQAENRLVAYLAPEPKLIDAFENEVDIHSRTASYIFNKPEEEISNEEGSAPQFGNGEHSERFWGKKANHAFNYGQSANAFSMQMLISSGEASTIYNAYHSAYPGVKKYHRMIKTQLTQNRTLTNLLGRKYTFLGRADYGLYLDAYAFIPQSTIADIINRWGLIPIYRKLPEVILLNQVHDSLVFQISKDVPLQRHAELILTIKSWLTQELTWNGRNFSIPCDLKILPSNLMQGVEIKLTEQCQREKLTEHIRKAL